MPSGARRGRHDAGEEHLPGRRRQGHRGRRSDRPPAPAAVHPRHRRRSLRPRPLAWRSGLSRSGASRDGGEDRPALCRSHRRPWATPRQAPLRPGDPYPRPGSTWGWPGRCRGLRRELGLDGGYAVGLVGSLILSERLGVSYGWDLVEALALTAPEVRALVVGDGSGLSALEARRGISASPSGCRFVGRVEPDARFCFRLRDGRRDLDPDQRRRRPGEDDRQAAAVPRLRAAGAGLRRRRSRPPARLARVDDPLPGPARPRLSGTAGRADRSLARRPGGGGDSPPHRRRNRTPSEFDPETMRGRLGELLAPRARRPTSAGCWSSATPPW